MRTLESCFQLALIATLCVCMVSLSRTGVGARVSVPTSVEARLLRASAQVHEMRSACATFWRENGPIIEFAPQPRVARTARKRSL